MTLTFCCPSTPRLAAMTTWPEASWALKACIILQTRVVGRQIQLFQPVLDTHIIEIIQSHDPGPDPPQDLDDPGKVGGPAHQRFLRVLGQGRLIQGHDGHMLRLIADARPTDARGRSKYFPALSSHPAQVMPCTAAPTRTSKMNRCSHEVFRRKFFIGSREYVGSEMTAALIGSRRVAGLSSLRTLPGG